MKMSKEDWQLVEYISMVVIVYIMYILFDCRPNC